MKIPRRTGPTAVQDVQTPLQRRSRIVVTLALTASIALLDAVLRWMDLSWYAGTKPLWHMIRLIATLCIYRLIIGVTVI